MKSLRIDFVNITRKVVCNRISFSMVANATLDNNHRVTTTRPLEFPPTTMSLDVDG